MQRPVLINGVLKPSYPSSTTMLSLCILPTAMIQFRRLMCGVHRLTHILGGIIFSTSLLRYRAANGLIRAIASRPCE